MNTSSFQARLLGVLLAATASACDDENRQTEEVCYAPGQERREGLARQTMPELPCLPRDDSRLFILNPGCTEDFELTAGPDQGTDASGQTICCYTRRYRSIANCNVGRPLWAGDEQRTAALATRPDWGV